MANRKKRASRAWLSVGGSLLGTVLYPVRVLTKGPKRALVELLVDSKMPSADGGTWREKGERTYVPSDSLQEKAQLGQSVVDGHGRVRSVKAKGKRRG